MNFHQTPAVLALVVASYLIVAQPTLGGDRTGISMMIALICLGFYILVVGGDNLVDGAGSIAKQFDISPLIIGLTIVAFGTSAPELFVNLIASTRGETDLLLANVIGSNMSNLLLIGGIASTIYVMEVKNSTLFKEIPFSLYAVVMLLVLMNDSMLNTFEQNIITRGDGIILLMTFIIFLYYIFSMMQASKTSGLEDLPSYSGWQSVFRILLGIGGLYLGGELIVRYASEIATSFGISKILIGSTIVAIGTSVPELVTSVIAALKKQTDMAVGNIIGSNIFNVFRIIGLVSLINPIPVPPGLNIDVFLLITTTLFFFTGIYSHHERSLTRFHGVIFLGMYVGYLCFLFYRG